MRYLKYLAALWVGIFFYSVITINSGAMGISAYRQLEAERDKELANIESLKIINQNLRSAQAAVLSDRDTLLVLARKQGFAAPNESLARIVGMGHPAHTVDNPGQIVTPIAPEFTPHKFIKVFAFCATLTLLICMGAYDLLNFLKER